MGKQRKIRPSRNRFYPRCDTSIWLRSCIKEAVEPVEGIQIGSVPEWITGSLLRNGPGNLQFGDMQFQHLFDCSALLHRFNIKNGKVTYQNKFLESKTYKRNQSANRIVVTEFGTKAVPDPCQTIFQRISTLFKPTESISDNAMISIYPFGDEYFAMTENPIIYQVDPKNLSTGKRINLGIKLGIINHTSHPHVMANGTVYNLGMTLLKTGPKYCILEFPSGPNIFENAKIVATIPCRWRFHPSYMHTFGITDNYFIIVEQPLTISVPKAVKNTILNQPLCGALQWHEKELTIIYLVSRASGQVEDKFVTNAFFYLHIINQYEEKNNVVVDICCYENPSMINCMYIDALKEAQTNPDYAKMFRGRPLRFVLTKTGKCENNFVTPKLLCTLGCETPRINYNQFCGKFYQYFYGISSDVDGDNPGNLIKVDTKTSETKIWGEPNIYPSEPVFVPNPDGVSEDDGIILSALIWGQNRTNFTGLLILNAKTWIEISRTIFQLDGPVPKCLHGWFVQQ